MLTQDFEDQHIARQTMNLFRYNIVAKDAEDIPCFIQLRYHNQSIHVKLEIFENGKLIHRGIAIGAYHTNRVVFKKSTPTEEVFSAVLHV